MSCFFSAIVTLGNDVAPFQLFNKFLDGFLEKGWTRGSQIEACRAEYQSFVQEQRQLERLATRNRPDVRETCRFAFCILVFVLASICIKYVSYPIIYVVLQLHVLVSFCSWACDASGVPVNSTCDPWSCNSWLEVHYEPWSVRHQTQRTAWCPALWAGFSFERALHTEEIPFGFWSDNAQWVCGHRR